MLIVIHSRHRHLEKVLQQVAVLHDASFITSLEQEVDSKVFVSIVDEEFRYGVGSGDEKIWIQKPAKIEELTRAILTRLNDRYYELDLGKFYPWRRAVVMADSTLMLTEKESAVLHCLMVYAPKPVHKKELLQEVWGYSKDSETSTVEAHIYRLRSKLTGLGFGDVIITGENSYMVKV